MPSTKLKSAIELGKQLKSIDGIDEVAQAAGQILPGIAGPIATLSVLTVATPFVYLGLLGMKEEYKEACEEYNEILKSRQPSEAKLLAMTANADKWREFLVEKLNLSIPDKSGATDEALGTSEKKGFNSNEFARNIVEYQSLRDKEFVAALGKKYGWTGIVGMGGMFAGMLPATASAGIGISKEVGKVSEAVLASATILSTISSAFFLVGQVFMAAYAANKVRQGKAIEKSLNSGKEEFNANAPDNEIQRETQKAVLEIIDTTLDFNKKCNIQYGYATVLGQTFMAAGTVASMTGAGAAVGIPLVAVGAPITVGAAIGRIVYSHKEKNFKGTGSDYSNERKKKTDLLKLLLEESENNKNATTVLETEFEFCSQQLACMKLYSLMSHLVNDRKYKNYTAEQKLTRLEEMVGTGNLSFSKGTSLRGDVLKRVKGIFDSNKKQIKFIMNLPKADANKVLFENIVICANKKEGGLNLFEKNIDLDLDLENKQSLQKLLELTGMQDHDIYLRLIIGNSLEFDYDYGPLSKLLVTKLKNSLKVIRHDLADKFVNMSHIKELRNEIDENKTYQIKGGGVSNNFEDTHSKEKTPKPATPKPALSANGEGTSTPKTNSEEGGGNAELFSPSVPPVPSSSNAESAQPKSWTYLCCCRRNDNIDSNELVLERNPQLTRSTSHGTVISL